MQLLLLAITFKIIGFGSLTKKDLLEIHPSASVNCRLYVPEYKLLIFEFDEVNPLGPCHWILKGG